MLICVEIAAAPLSERSAGTNKERKTMREQPLFIELPKHRTAACLGSKHRSLCDLSEEAGTSAGGARSN